MQIKNRACLRTSFGVKFRFVQKLETGGIAYLLQSGAQICGENFILGALSTLGALLDNIVQGALEPVGFPMSLLKRRKQQQQQQLFYLTENLFRGNF